MPDLPARPSLEHFKKQAKRLLKEARSGEAQTLARVGPYFGTPSEISLQQAQLVIAREYGFSSWTRLKRRVAQGETPEDETERRTNRFLDLACLYYGPAPARGVAEFEAAAALLSEHPEIARHSPHAAAAAGAADVLSDMIAADPNAVDAKGGPFQWTPLMYAAYARVPGVSTFAAGQVLLHAGADPNAHYMWGGTYRFAVLTGVFGDGEGGKMRLPEHPDMVPFARAVLDAGANPNDSQGAYNRCFNPDNTHLELMLEYGLKDSDPSDWWLTEEGHAPHEHRTMHFQLIIALRWGFADRARLLIAHGVDLNTPDQNYYPTYTVGYTPYQVALMRGLPEVAALIKAKGGRAEPLSGPARFQAACMAGDLDRARDLAQEYLGTDPQKDAELLREAAGNGNLAAVKTMITVGFDLNPVAERTALHAAAWKGHTGVITALLEAGADTKLRDPEHFSPPLGHAMHAEAQGAIDLLMQAEMDIFMAAALGDIEQIKARLAEDASWLNAAFARVRPMPDKSWHNDWAPPLFYAAVNGRVDAVAFLMARGADTGLVDAQGRSVADHAEAAGQTETAALIRAQTEGANPTIS